MRKKEFFLIGTLVVLVGCYLYFFRDWTKPGIQITPSFRPPHRNSTATLFPVLFTLDQPYALTSLEVVLAETNKVGSSPLPLWHLVAKTNSPPTKMIPYGVPIRGMEPAIARVHPQALVPDVAYRIILTAGELKGEALFHTKAMPGKSLPE